MRLVTKVLLIYLGITLIVFLVGGWVTYSVIQRTVDVEQQRHLKEQLESITDRMASGIPANNLETERIRIRDLGSDTVPNSDTFTDTLILHPWLHRMEPFTMLNATRKVDSLYYAFSMYDLMVESDDITEGVQESLVKIYLILFGGVLVITLALSTWLFRPFNRTLERISSFALRSNTPLQLPPTRTREFKRLNDFLLQMTEKNRKDYRSLKEFSDNASHEMQTPLAVARGKLELLLASPNLNQEDLQLVQSAQQSIHKLSKLGQALGLLTKIGNEEFTHHAPLNISQLLKDKLFDVEELMELKQISVDQKIQAGIQVNLDPILADVLITNLLQNAIRHNVSEGQIAVQLTEEHLQISNTGPKPEVDNPQELFERFKKGQQNGESLGLGLAIVKQICDRKQWNIQYLYGDGWHTLQVDFSAK